MTPQYIKPTVINCPRTDALANITLIKQTMNVISPQAQAESKPSAAAASIALFPALPFQVLSTAESQSSKSMICPEKNRINAYALFLVLEKQRNLKLRELYRQRLDVCSVDKCTDEQHEHYEVSLPKLPPRYQNLKVSVDWLMLKLRKQRPTSKHSNEYKALDNVTKTFLDDTVRVLQDQCEEDDIINNVCSRIDFCPTPMMPRSSITVTPPSSPRRLPRITLSEEDNPLKSLSRSPSDSIHEVDLTDEQIMSIYEISEPSGDAVVLNSRLI